MNAKKVSTTKNGYLTKVKILNRKEGRQLLDRQARRYFGVTGKEFVRKWKANEFDDPEHPDVIKVAFLIPFGG
jgi:hypothetical protein